MFRELALLAVLACTALSAPTDSLDYLPEHYKATEYADYLKSLTNEEKAALKELAQEQKSFKSEDEIMAALKEKSASLHEKVLKLQASIEAKVEELGDEAKAFVKKVMADRRAIGSQVLAGNSPSQETLMAKGLGHRLTYQALSNEAKEQFKAKFPFLSAAVENYIKGEKH